MILQSNAAAFFRNSTPGTASVLEFANGGLMSGTSATLLLNSKDLVPNIQRLTAENQTKLVDKVDQVCQNGSHSVMRNFDPLFLRRLIRPSTCKTSKLYPPLGMCVARSGAFRLRPHSPRGSRYATTFHTCPEHSRTCGGESPAAPRCLSRPSVSIPLKTWTIQRGYADDQGRRSILVLNSH